MIASHPDVQAAATKVRAAYLDLQRDTLVAPVSATSQARRCKWASACSRARR